MSAIKIKSIGDLGFASALDKSEFLEIEQNGVSRKIRIGDLPFNPRQGKSAYEIALQNGFVGTEIQWLFSLMGAKGEKGDTGERGEKGEPGEAASLSADPGNRLKRGSDGGLFVPELDIDPIAAYLEASS